MEDSLGQLCGKSRELGLDVIPGCLEVLVLKLEATALWFRVEQSAVEIELATISQNATKSTLWMRPPNHPTCVGPIAFGSAIREYVPVGDARQRVAKRTTTGGSVGRVDSAPTTWDLPKDCACDELRHRSLPVGRTGCRQSISGARNCRFRISTGAMHRNPVRPALCGPASPVTDEAQWRFHTTSCSRYSQHSPTLTEGNPGLPNGPQLCVRQRVEHQLVHL